MNALKYLLLAGSICLASNAQASLRCENGIASEGQSSTEVLEKCGEPASRSVVGYIKDTDQRVEMQIEEGVYAPRSGGMYHYLKFEGGRLKKVESKRGG